METMTGDKVIRKWDDETRTTLKEFYKEKCEAISQVINGKKLSMEHCFINLTILKHRESQILTGASTLLERQQMANAEKEEYTNLKHSFNRPRSTEELYVSGESQKIIKINEIFPSSEHLKETNRVFLLGRAGIGKTTLCQKIIYEHCNHGMWKDQFDRIIWIPLRILKQSPLKEESNISFTEVLKQRFATVVLQHQEKPGVIENLSFGEILSEINTKDETKVLYLLDGWDEIQNLLGDPKYSKFFEQLSQKPFVITTSRPYTYHENYYNFDFILETIGFSKQNIINYVRVLHSDDIKIQNQIIDFLQKSSGVISGLANIPLMLNIICHIWEEISGFELNITMTKLYDILENYLWGQFYKNRANLIGNGGEELRNIDLQNKTEIYSKLKDIKIDPYSLPKVAYKMFVENQIEFTTKEAMPSPEFDSSQKILLKNTYFLHCLNPTDEDLNEIVRSYIFMHLSLQEYFAAVYIVRCLQEKHSDFEKAIYHKYNSRYSLVWSFVCGILAESVRLNPNDSTKEHLEIFFNYLERDPVDELGLAHQHLILNCLNECTHFQALDVLREKRLLDELFSWIWFQSIARGNSLYTGQHLPVKILDRLIGKPDDWWDRSVELCQEKVLSGQRNLPEHIVSHLLEELLKIDIKGKSRWLLNVLKQQNYFAFGIVNLISLKIEEIISSKQSGKMVDQVISKVLALLKSQLSISDADSENFSSLLCTLLEFCKKRKKDEKDKIVDICFNLQDISPEVLAKVVAVYNPKGKIKEMSLESLIGTILEESKHFPIHYVQKLAKQVHYSDILQTSLRKYILDSNYLTNWQLLCRAIFLFSSYNLDKHIQTRLIEIFQDEHTPHNVKAICLYTLSNSESINEEISRYLFSLLSDCSIRNTSHEFLNSMVMLPKFKFSLPIDFSYLVRLIPIMKLEFYENFKLKNSRNQYDAFGPGKNYDLTMFEYLGGTSKNVGVTLKQLLSLYPYESQSNFCREIEIYYERFWAVDDGYWLNMLKSDVSQFLSKYKTKFEKFFDEYKPDPCQESLTIDRFNGIMGNFMGEEKKKDRQLVIEITSKYLPLVILGHRSLNKINLIDEETNSKYTRQLWDHQSKAISLLDELGKPNEAKALEEFSTSLVESEEPLKYIPPKLKKDEILLEVFSTITSKLLQDQLIVKTLNNSTLSENVVRDLETLLSSKTTAISLKISILQILQKKNLHANTINEMIEIIARTKYEEEAKFASFCLIRQNLSELNMERLLRYISDVKYAKNPNLNYVSLIFKNHPELIKKNTDKFFWHIKDSNLDVREKVLHCLVETQLEREDYILKIVETIYECMCIESYRLLSVCLDILLLQKNLPTSVFTNLTAYFNFKGKSMEEIYFYLLQTISITLPLETITHLYKLIDTQYRKNLREGLQVKPETEVQIRDILTKQPLWNLIKAQHLAKFQRRGEISQRRNILWKNFTTKDEVIVEKILCDPVPMAILKKNGKYCCFSPLNDEDSQLVFGTLSLDGILPTFYDPHGQIHLKTHLHLPYHLDKMTRYLQFHSPEENLIYIHSAHLSNEVKQYPSHSDSFTISVDKNNYYIRVKIMQLKQDVEDVIESLLTIVKDEEYRHLDLRENDLTDVHVAEIKKDLLNTLENGNYITKGFRTIILSHNKLTIKSLNTLMEMGQQSSKHRTVENLFLDHNRIYFTEADFRKYIDAHFRCNSTGPALSTISTLRKSNIKFLDVSMNYISSGGQYFEKANARNAMGKYQDDMKVILTNDKYIHSQYLQDDNNAKLFGTVTCFCDDEFPRKDPQKINTSKGCVIVAEKTTQGFVNNWLIQKGHAFIVVEWIPDSEYGQKQIILADLRKIGGNRLGIRIEEITPDEFIKRLSPRNCKNFRRVFKENAKIQNLVKCFYESQNTCDIYDYYLLASVRDYRNAGGYNCITWADEMLETALGIQKDTMYISRQRLCGTLFLSLITIIIAVLVFSYYQQEMF